MWTFNILIEKRFRARENAEKKEEQEEERKHAVNENVCFCLNVCVSMSI